MMAKLMELLERFVVAVEKIAEQREAPNALIPGPVVYTPAPVNGNGAAPANTEAQARNDAAHLTREFLKKELTAKGIKFNASAKTETLQKLFDGVNRAGIAPTVTDMPSTLEELAAVNDKVILETEAKIAAANTVAAVTKDITRDALVALSALKDKDEALSVLKTIGKAEKLSDVEPANYKAIVDACKVRGVTING